MIPLHGMLSELHERLDIRPRETERRMRWPKLYDQLKLLKKALDSEDRAGIARYLAEVVYECYGTAIVNEIRLDIALKEVHAARMSMMNTDQRGPHYKEPDMAVAIAPYTRVVVRDE